MFKLDKSERTFLIVQGIIVAVSIPVSAFFWSCFNRINTLYVGVEAPPLPFGCSLMSASALVAVEGSLTALFILSTTYSLVFFAVRAVGKSVKKFLTVQGITWLAIAIIAILARLIIGDNPFFASSTTVKYLLLPRIILLFTSVAHAIWFLIARIKRKINVIP